jgi:hypothetical protein
MYLAPAVGLSVEQLWLRLPVRAATMPGVGNEDSGDVSDKLTDLLTSPNLA